MDEFLFQYKSIYTYNFTLNIYEDLENGDIINLRNVNIFLIHTL